MNSFDNLLSTDGNEAKVLIGSYRSGTRGYSHNADICSRRQDVFSRSPNQVATDAAPLVRAFHEKHREMIGFPQVEHADKLTVPLGHKCQVT
jgi:hypothetical protein